MEDPEAVLPGDAVLLCHSAAANVEVALVRVFPAFGVMSCSNQQACDEWQVMEREDYHPMNNWVKGVVDCARKAADWMLCPLSSEKPRSSGSKTADVLW